MWELKKREKSRVTEVGCTGRGRSQGFDFDYAHIDVLAKHTNRAMEKTVEYLGLGLRGMLRTRNINLGVISMVMLLKT